MIRLIDFKEQKKRMDKWKHKEKGLLAFLISQHASYRAKGFECIGHFTKPGAFHLAKALDRQMRDVILIETGEVTATSRIPIYDVYRSYQTRNRTGANA